MCPRIMGEGEPGHRAEGELPETDPALAERLWQFVTLLETEIRPDQIFEPAGWFGSVLQGAAVVAEEEGLTLTG